METPELFPPTRESPRRTLRGRLRQPMERTCSYAGRVSRRVRTQPNVEAVLHEHDADCLQQLRRTPRCRGNPRISRGGPASRNFEVHRIATDRQWTGSPDSHGAQAVSISHVLEPRNVQ